ncbi:putative envelope protein ODV-E66-6 [Microplitis demolitor]|uniref:putative envelope protein ODV-E66-6 n=1 Tax=Microplitis demolitor TaxID=69319 RepID=UPI00043FFF57|nr:putative envelope protein ODV-E66-6 [Microplitis demolitor]KAG6558544.1 putative envelope protein ODV-E66-6 [Microplitis demolitor]
MIGKKVKIIGIVVAVILIIGGVTAVIILTRKSLPDPETVKKIRRGLKVGSSTISRNHLDIIEKFDEDAANFPSNKFPGWDTTEEQLKELTLFAISLLELNVTNDYMSKCLLVVKSIIKSIISKLELTNGPLIRFPWAENWYPFSVYVTRLFSMYEYLGDDSDLQKKCHYQLKRITPYLGISFQSTKKGENLFYVAVPRLCSNYLSEPELFINDQADRQFTELKRYLEFPIITTNDIKEGRYADGSWIYSGNVASYVELRKYDEYYERMYRLLGFSTGLEDAAKSILPKLLHPSIPFLPLGLVGRSGKVYNYKKYSNITSKIGVFVMPFMGFGVFKTQDFLFYVRVQRPGIAAFQSKKFNSSSSAVNTNDLGLGWVQLRKLYRNNYARNSNKITDFTWEKLKEQPGLLYFIDNSLDPLNVFAVTGEDQTKSFQTNQTTLNSYIGQLNAHSMDISEKVLFWLNIYDFDDVYKNGCKVTEAAIVTDQGLQAYYIIENHTNTDMKFICKDDQTDWEFKINKVEATNNYHQVPADSVTKFHWQVLHSDIDYDVKYNKDLMTFSFRGKNYTINVNTPNKTYTVKEDNEILFNGSMENTRS